MTQPKTKAYTWFEAWIDPLSAETPPCSVLLLMSTVQPQRWSGDFTTYGDNAPSPTSFDVVDPATGQIHYAGQTYQDATAYLNEDGYELITGRTSVEGEQLPLIGRYGVE
ncbi:MAG: hypothetical protein EON86_18235 [Brevundimonas sp.]|nr:MAG: hypothetical protein EON86_18235 [Brevundimonas sp.]